MRGSNGKDVLKKEEKIYLNLSIHHPFSLSRKGMVQTIPIFLLHLEGSCRGQTVIGFI